MEDAILVQQQRLAKRLRSSPTGELHGFSIRWGGTTLTAEGFYTCEEMEAARSAAFDRMAAEGWTQPRWWQFWRSGDTKR